MKAKNAEPFKKMLHSLKCKLDRRDPSERSPGGAKRPSSDVDRPGELKGQLRRSLAKKGLLGTEKLHILHP